MRRLIPLLLTLACIAPARAASISFWQWNGIVLRLEAQGDERTLLYEKMPADYAVRLGIAPGATFWQGRRVGDRLEGSGFLYGAGCTPATFNMTGSANLDSAGELRLTATPPERAAKSCAIGPPEGSKSVSFVLKLVGRPKTIKDVE